MNDEKTKWSADPAKGAEFVAQRRDELLYELRNAADVALAAIDENEKEAIAKIKEEAGKKRAKINSTIGDIEKMPTFKMIAKFWHSDREKMWMHFLGDQTKIGAQNE